MLKHFWDKWKREYICQLQGRSKRWNPPVMFEILELVIIQDKNQLPMRWRMGRVIDVKFGTDEVVKICNSEKNFWRLKTSSQKCLRATSFSQRKFVLVFHPVPFLKLIRKARLIRLKLVRSSDMRLKDSQAKAGRFSHRS